MSKTFYLTTPIFYPNALLHLGHAYAMVMADIIVRYKKSRGYTVYFQTGSDDHGEKIARKAASLGLTPQQLVDKNVLIFQQLWKELNISEHVFYRTSSPEHKEKVQKIFTELLKRGDIYLGEYQGKYCIACEDYVSGSKIANNNFCPASNCQAELREINELAYFFKVSKYYSQLIEHYRKNPDFLLPANAKKELFSNFLKESIPDLCITRSDVKWGISVPGNQKMVVYVWFEALLNYLNSEPGGENFLAGFPETEKISLQVSDKVTEYFLERLKDGEIVHLIGKEIVRFHAIYWPIILFSLDKRLPNRILAHGWLVDSKGRKESKSIGNTTDPLELLKKYPPDLLRIYFSARINFLQDGVCSEELLKGFYHDFLVNNLGNLVSRTNKMLHLYCKGVIPKLEEVKKNETLETYYFKCSSIVKNFLKKMNEYELTGAFLQIEQLVSESNKLISDLAPWKLAKEGDFSLLNYTLSYLSNGIKIIAFLLSSIAPETSQKIFEIFAVDQKKISWDNCLDFNFMNGIKVKLLERHLYEPLK